MFVVCPYFNYRTEMGKGDFKKWKAMNINFL
jgi:hypothetical protein